MKVSKIVSPTLHAFFALHLLVAGLIQPALAQDAKRLERERERGLQMLKGTKELLKENYYDPTFHAMDLEARFKVAEEKMKQAESLGQIFGIIAQALVELNDSHT